MAKPNDKHESTIVKRAGGRHRHEDHGGAWKVAFADFCLALMALFLVLWLIAAREQQHLQKIVRDATESGLMDQLGQKPAIATEPNGSLIERFEMPRTGSTGSPGAPRVGYETPAELAALSRALAELSADAGLSSNLATVVTPYGLRVMLHDTDKQGMFMRGSALPTGSFTRLLHKIGPLFAQMKNQMLIVGHTDASRYARADNGGYNNWALSTDRALSARAALIKGGMRADSVLQIVGMAERGPLDAHDPLAGPNRRIELLILTRRQSSAVSAMFGAPGGHTTVTTVTGSDASLRALHGQLPTTP